MRAGQGTAKTREINPAIVPTLTLPAAPRGPEAQGNLSDLRRPSAQRGPAGPEVLARRRLPAGRWMGVLRTRTAPRQARGVGVSRGS